MRIIRFLLVGFGIIPIIIVGMILLTVLQSAFGYYPGNPGWEVAEIAVSKGKNVNECKKILGVPWGGMGPTTGEQRILCIHEYAKLTKDPSACELLMPSSYGLDCVGAAEESLPCSFTTKPYAIYWRDGDIEHEIGLRECYEDANKFSKLGQQCCQIAKVTYLKNENDCSSLQSSERVFNRCLYNRAWKNKDPGICNGMTLNNQKSACIVQTTALRKDPSICQDCLQPLNDLSELK